VTPVPSSVVVKTSGKYSHPWPWHNNRNCTENVLDTKDRYNGTGDSSLLKKKEQKSDVKCVTSSRRNPATIDLEKEKENYGPNQFIASV
jgi:hypothetical protein